MQIVQSNGMKLGDVRGSAEKKAIPPGNREDGVYCFVVRFGLEVSLLRHATNRPPKIRKNLSPRIVLADTMHKAS